MRLGYDDIFQWLLEEDFVDKSVNNSVNIARINILLSRNTEIKTSCLQNNRMLKLFYLN